MDQGPRRRLVQRTLDKCLSVIRQHGHLPETEFSRAVEDLPAFLRKYADAIEMPPDDLDTRAEPPGLAGYEIWAQTYDDLAANRVVAGEEEVIWDLIGPARGQRVLDAGCGTGRHAIRLAMQGAHIVGCDPSPAMLERAKRKADEAGLSIDLNLGGIDELPANLGPFDLVLCCLVLSHVEDLASALKKLASCVRPGGRMIVSDFHPMWLLLGSRTAFSREEQNYIVPNTIHLVSDYFRALAGAGMHVTELHERGAFSDTPGVPATLIIAAKA